jgi:hypothetical protein
MANGAKMGIGIVLLFVGIWTSGILDMIGINVLSFLPALTLPQLIPGIPTGFILLLIGIGVTYWGYKSY